MFVIRSFCGSLVCVFTYLGSLDFSRENIGFLSRGSKNFSVSRGKLLGCKMGYKYFRVFGLWNVEGRLVGWGEYRFSKYW